MAVPKRRVSRTVGKMRRTHWKKAAPTLSKCANCGEVKPPHQACQACGTYRKRKVLDVE